MKIFWSSIEYSYINNRALQGGFVYIFVSATNKTEALSRICKALKKNDMQLLNCEFIEEYTPSIKWKTKKLSAHYNSLYEEAKVTKECIFDNFYAYE